ncbi:MAG: hypothetical protein IID45_07685 [Planctomycetes bacterium]|nr:hypothetical protein [Planctomycetota bacterium]
MSSISLAIARICLAAWVGAAALFVVSSVREATNPDFSSETKELLVQIRFPDYYRFGFTLCAAAGIGLLGARNHEALSGKRFRIGFGLVLIAFISMAVDYFFIYTPLLEMISNPNVAKPSGFVNYHNASKYINFVNILLFFIAAAIVCPPGSRERQATVKEE